MFVLDPCMAIHQHKNTLSGPRLPVFLTGLLAIIILVFFLVCIAMLIVTPVTALEPDNQTLIKNLRIEGRDCFYSGDYPCTWAAFESAHQMDPGDSTILFTHAYYLFETGNYTGALAKKDAELSLDPQNARIWYEKGKILDKLGRFIESGSSYDRAEELDPSLRVPATERFPLNVLMMVFVKNAGVIVVMGGFILLGFYIYFRERCI